MTKVDITTAGHTVVVDADEPLDMVAAKALELWRDTRDPAIRSGYGATGFSTERAAGPEYTAEHDATLGVG